MGVDLWDVGGDLRLFKVLAPRWVVPGFETGLGEQALGLGCLVGLFREFDLLSRRAGLYD